MLLLGGGAHRKLRLSEVSHRNERLPVGSAGCSRGASSPTLRRIVCGTWDMCSHKADRVVSCVCANRNHERLRIRNRGVDISYHYEACLCCCDAVLYWKILGLCSEALLPCPLTPHSSPASIAPQVCLRIRPGPSLSVSSPT